LFKEWLDIETEVVHLVEHLDGRRGRARIRSVHGLPKEAKPRDAPDLASRQDTGCYTRNAPDGKHERMILDPLECISCRRHAKHTLLRFVGDDAGDSEYLLWLVRDEPVKDAGRDLVADHGVDRDIGNDGGDIVFHVKPHGIVYHAFVHHGKRGKVPGGHGANKLELELVDHVLERNRADKPAPGKPHQHRSALPGWRICKNREVMR